MASARLPSGAWSRVRVLGLTVLCMLGLAACGPVSTNEVLPREFVDPPEVSAQALAQFGDGAEGAYDQVAHFLLTQSYLPPMLDPEVTDVTVEQLTDGILPALSPEASAAWKDMATKAVAGDAEARSAVRLLRFHTWDAEGSTLPPHSSDPLRSQVITRGVVDVAPTEAGSTALRIELVHRANMTLAEDNVPYDMTLVKPLTLTLVPSAQDPSSWLIDSLDGELRIRVDQDAEGPGVTDDGRQSAPSPGAPQARRAHDGHRSDDLVGVHR